MSPDLDELLCLRAAGTQGELSYNDDGVIETEADGIGVAVLFTNVRPGYPVHKRENGNLIAAAVNAVVPLCMEVRETRRLIDAANERHDRMIAELRAVRDRLALAERVAEALSASMSRPHGPMGGLAEHMELKRAVKSYEQARDARGKVGG